MELLTVQHCAAGDDQALAPATEEQAAAAAAPDAAAAADADTDMPDANDADPNPVPDPAAEDAANAAADESDARVAGAAQQRAGGSRRAVLAEGMEEGLEGEDGAADELGGDGPGKEGGREAVEGSYAAALTQRGLPGEDLGTTGAPYPVSVFFRMWQGMW